MNAQTANHSRVAAELAADSADGEDWAISYLLAVIRVTALEAVDRGVRAKTWPELERERRGR